MTTNATHTPGPWKAQIRKVGSHVTGPSGFAVAQVGKDDDARLISAAPELLAAARYALITLRMACEHFHEKPDAIGELESAIKKAEGT
ncbi:MAG: hypothetical protein WC935_00015 [Thermoleophilia bacterium]